MNLIQEVQSDLTAYLSAQHIALYDMSFVHENSMRILRIMITKIDGSVDIDTCSEVSQWVSERLDALDESESEYYLEVCSAGAERELRSAEEISHACGKHVYIKLKEPWMGMDEVSGDLLSFAEDQLVVSYRVKTANRKVTLAYAQVALIRLAVRI